MVAHGGRGRSDQGKAADAGMASGPRLAGGAYRLRHRVAAGSWVGGVAGAGRGGRGGASDGRWAVDNVDVTETGIGGCV